MQIFVDKAPRAKKFMYENWYR